MMYEFVQWLQEQGLPPVVVLPPVAFPPSGLGSEPPAVGASGDTGQPRVGFGKHREMTYQDTLENEKGYCQWVVQKFLEEPDQTNLAMAEFARWLQEQGVEPRT